MDFKSVIKGLFAKVDCSVSETYRNADIFVRNEKFYFDLLSKPGSLAIGEAYVNQDIIINDLPSTVEKLYKLSTMSLYDLLGWKVIIFLVIYIKMLISFLTSYFLNKQTISVSEKNIEHYNLDHTFYNKMLGKTMQYSCAYFKNDNENDNESLDQAQLNKVNKIIDKLKLQQGQKVLEIGSGYGFLGDQIMKRVNCVYLGLNISDGQLQYSINNYGNFFLKFDYRELQHSSSRYNRIVSVGMFEHVGKNNYKLFFKIINKILEDEGIFVLHTIVGKQRYIDSTDAFLDKYIFHGGMIPHLLDIIEAIEGTELKLEHVEDFGLNYAKTLKMWSDNLHRESSMGRIFEYYLNICKVSFEIGNLTLNQIVFSKNYNKVYKY